MTEHSALFVIHMRRWSVSVNQILCGYEDANDCDRLRGDSALKMSVGRRPSDGDLCSQATMTRLENNVDSKTLYKIGKLFVEQYVKSFTKPPRHVILDADDTNANTYGDQQLTLFNAYYNEYCYMPLLIFDGVSKKLILPMLRPGRRNKSLNVSRILRGSSSIFMRAGQTLSLSFAVTAISAPMSSWTGHGANGMYATLQD